MDTPKPKPFSKSVETKRDRPKPRRGKSRETKTKSRKVEWDVTMPNSTKTISVRAETEIQAVEMVVNTHGDIPEKVTRKKGNKEFVRPEHLTYRPFSNLESILKGS